MRLFKFISLFIFFASITTCKKENMGDCFKSTGKIVEEQRQTADFYSIEVEDRINLHLTQSNQRTITVKAGKKTYKNLLIYRFKTILYTSKKTTIDVIG